MRVFEIPEERSEQIAWLESEVMGTQLHSLVAELTAVHGGSVNVVATESLADRWDETTRNAVRERGLAALSDDQFVELLQHSQQLLQVQRDVLEHGGRYWSEVDSPTDLTAPSAFETARSDVSPSDVAPQTTTQRRATRSSLGSNIASALIGALATAAALLLFLRPPETTNTARQPTPEPVIVQELPTDEPPAPTIQLAQKPMWGFEKFAAGVEAEANQLEPPLNRKAYLQELAKAAEAWTNERPDTPTALAQRIGEFRMGCSAILLATHEPLPKADRVWLKERCQSWASALDRHLADVESGRAVEQVRADIDSTVTKIAAALLGRADTPTG